MSFSESMRFSMTKTSINHQIYEIMMVTLISHAHLLAGWSGQEAEGVAKGCMGGGQTSGSIPDWLGQVTDLPPLLLEKGCEDHLTKDVSSTGYHNCRVLAYSYTGCFVLIQHQPASRIHRVAETIEDLMFQCLVNHSLSRWCISFMCNTP